jgi:hypothetical protein
MTLSPRVSALPSPLDIEVTRICVTLKLAQNGYTTVDESHSGHVNRCFPELGTQRREGVVGLPTHPRMSTTAILIILLSLAAACTGSDVTTQPLTPAPTPTPSPTSSIDPRAQPAVRAYEAFSDRAKNALRKPFGANDRPPVDADFTRYAFDPFLAEYQSYVWGLKHDGVQFRGTPPKRHIAVTSIELDAAPWPTITLSDCQTEGSGWRAYDVKTGAALPQTKPSVPPPYPSTVSMILYKNRWGVQKIKVDASRTCTA